MTSPAPACSFDHAILAVHDLAAASALFRDLGFLLSPEGRHPTRGTANACVMFPGGYIELLSTTGPSSQEAFLVEFLAAGEGVSALALGPDDVDRCHRLMVEWGIDDREPVTGSRSMETPAGPVTVRFRVCRIRHAAILPGRVFLCQHLDRALVYDPALMAHPNGAADLLGLTLLGDPAAMIAPDRAGALGLKRIAQGPGSATLKAGSVAIELLDPALAETRLGPFVRALPTGRMRVAEIRLAAREPALIGAKAAGRGLAVEPLGGGAVGVTLHGVRLRIERA
ncbi:MAG: VOC family protein [Alphaproteobacteria bacterium]|nr:VOC family protein [Alphaproteobacteria bacterium]